MKLKPAWDAWKATFQAFSEDLVLHMSAALAYYAMFSVGPLLVLVIGLASLVLSRQGAQQQVQSQLQSLVGPKTASLLDSMRSASQAGGGLAATVMGAIGLAIGATGVFVQLQESLNIIFGVFQKPSAWVAGYLLNRALSLLMVLAIGLLLLVSIVLSTVIRALGGSLSLPSWVLYLGNELLWFGLATGFFALIFKYLPLAKIPWRDVWRGALVTSALLVLGKYLLGLYLGSIGAKSAFGAASSFVVFLMFVDYAAVIFFFGAEFTKVQAARRGAEIRPSQYAVKLSALQRAAQGRPSAELLRQAEEHSQEPPPEEQRKAA